MTGKDAVLQVMVNLNRLNTASNRVIQPEVVLLMLNKAALKLTKEKYFFNINRGIASNDREGFQKNQYSTDELNSLVVTASINAVNGVAPLPSDYLFHVRHSVIIKRADNSETVSHTPKLQKIDNLGEVYSDPFNKPNEVEPVSFFSDNYIQSDAGTGNTVTKILFNYLKKPEEITLTSVVKLAFIDDVIDAAVTLILDTWESPRMATQPQINEIFKIK